MFANRFTAFVDACVLAGALKRNILLTLAEAEFFRIRWSGRVLMETQAAIEKILLAKDVADASERAASAKRNMERAFEEASVTDYELFLAIVTDVPDPDDAHVIAAALKAQAATIVTDNLRHFPDEVLVPLNLEARSSDAFIADTIALDPGRAVAAIGRMRRRLKKPEKTAPVLLLDMEASGLLSTVDMLREHVESL